MPDAEDLILYRLDYSFMGSAKFPDANSNDRDS